MRLAVLQPMYLPWIGYFSIIDQSDIFVFYDDVQFVRDSWQRRNRIKVPEASGGTKWLTVPVIKDKGQTINEVKISNEDPWQEKHWELITQAYSTEAVPFGREHAPYFEEYAQQVAPYFECDWESLSELNTSLIETLCDILEINDTEFLYSSDMDISGSGTDRLVRILESLDASEYINGPSGKNYLDVSRFETAGIELYWHNFDHPEYDQPYGGFESHMSVIDFIFNVGPEATKVLSDAERNSLVAAGEM